MIVGLVVLFCLGAVFIMAFLGYKKGLKWSGRLLLIELVIWLFSLTVLFRPVLPERRFNFTPFWNYNAIQGGNELLLTQSIMNVVAFIPVGLLLGYVFERMNWWKAGLIGGAFSVLIETLQFVFKRGFAEFDDVFHNVIGCLIGYGLYVGIASLAKCVAKKRSVRLG